MAQKANTFLTLLSRIDNEGGFNACWPWLGNSFSSGYGRFKLKGKEYLVHRLIYEYYYNSALCSKDVVMHLCDNPTCCNPLHLAKGTAKDNVKDKMLKGRFSNGTKTNKDNKLKDTQKIVELYNKGLSQQRIAKQLNCHRHTVRNHLIRSGFVMSS
jgi:hypothetical protein